MQRLDRLVVPHEVFDALAEGRPAPEVTDFLTRSVRGTNLLLLKAVGDGAPEARPALAALAELHRRSPARTDRVLHYPAVSAWSRETVRRLGAGLAAPADRLTLVAAAAAARTGFDYSAPVRIHGGHLMLPTLGRWSAGDGEHLLSVRDGRVRLSGRPPHEAGLLRSLVAGGPPPFALTVEDLDPYRFPGPTGARLSTVELAGARRSLETAWRLLCRDHRRLAAEIRAVYRSMTPLPAVPGGAASATSRTAFGTIGLRCFDDPLRLAAAFAHEVQHAKLTALLDLVDLVEDDSGAYYAPWRPDPRPLGGLLHGTYAHLGVAAFWRRQRWAGGGEAAQVEFVRWRDAAAESAEVVAASGALTPLGRRFVEGMRRTLRGFHRDEVSAGAVLIARTDARRHRIRFGQQPQSGSKSAS